MGLQDIPYIVVRFLVQFYKWLELKFMETFSSSLQLERTIRHTYAKIGVLIDFELPKEEDNNNQLTQNSAKKTIIDEEYVKKKSAFEGVIRIKVHDKEFFTRIANSASLGMGETYLNKGWDCDNLPELFRRIMRKKIFMRYLNPWNRFLNYIHLSFFNLQTETRAWEVGREHYDLGNDLFKSFLDPWLTYSCGYWARADNLNDAQIAKMELIAKKLNLKKGMRVLDIGCGWGGLCKFLAQNYEVSVVGITISKEGAKFAQSFCAGLDVEIRLADYRDLDEPFDRIVSVGMFEHVGNHNHRKYFEVARRCLKDDDGIFLLHTIGINHQEMPRIEPFFNRYIFVNGSLPYYQDITKATEGLFILEDWHNFGPDYAKTLLAWLANFEKNWPNIRDNYGDRFYRLWTYYLQSSAGGFQSRAVQLWQICLTKDGIDNYRAAR